MCITGYFLRLSNNRQDDGRKDYLRVSCGHLADKRWVGSDSEAKAALLREIDRGNLTARLQPAYGPLPCSQIPEPADVEQLCSSDGTVISQKVNGRWQDVEDPTDDATWRAAILKSPADMTDEDRRVIHEVAQAEAGL